VLVALRRPAPLLRSIPFAAVLCEISGCYHRQVSPRLAATRPQWPTKSETIIAMMTANAAAKMTLRTLTACVSQHHQGDKVGAAWATTVKQARHTSEILVLSLYARTILPKHEVMARRPHILFHRRSARRPLMPSASL
jgi:hypothetical protein